MNADSVIKKLRIIEQKPDVIWEAFDKHYKRGFFNSCIENEFGITPDTHD